MTNIVLGLIAAALWGGAYGAYFASDMRRLWRSRGRRAEPSFAELYAPPPRTIWPHSAPFVRRPGRGSLK